MARDPSFEVAMDEGAEPRSALLVGVAELGAASLTALDYLVNELDADRIGRLRTRNLPDVTPITDGVPRHPVRFYDVPEADLTLLVSEAFLPVSVADPLADTLAAWATANDLEEVTVLYSAPFPHGEAEHALFHVGTDAYRERYFGDGASEGLQPLPGGVIDGVVGELLTRGLEEGLPPVGVLVTPSHPPGPDFEAAARLVDGVESLYGLDVDEEELHRRSEAVQHYYEGLVQRLQALREGEQPIGSRDFPEDRMYM